ncbi:MAG: TRAP transporter small permease subunit [Firmicutes bacterium]|nr:TRAP transporter small permease subunit [Bacillota bacterium]
MKKVIVILTRIITGFSVIALTIATAITVEETLSRVIFKISHDWAEETTRYLLIGAALCISAPMMMDGGHIKLDILSAKLKKKTHLWLHKLFISTLSMIVSFFLVIWSIKVFIKFKFAMTPSLNFTTKFPNGILIMGVACIFIFSSIHFIQLIVGRIKGEI